MLYSIFKCANLERRAVPDDEPGQAARQLPHLAPRELERLLEEPELGVDVLDAELEPVGGAPHDLRDALVVETLRGQVTNSGFQVL